jgi:transposase
MEGILEGHRAGRPPIISERQRQQLTDILESGPVAYGFSSGVWTCPMIARVIEDEFSLSYHPAHVSRILHSLEFSVQRPQKILARADKALQSKWIRYRYPNLKKKPKAKRQPSSSKTKPASARTPRSTRPGRVGARSHKSPPQDRETP